MIAQSLQLDSRFRVDVLQTPDAESWDRAASGVSVGGLFQSTYWASRLQELVRCTPVYFAVNSAESSEPVARLLAFEVRSPVKPPIASDPVRWLRQTARGALRRHVPTLRWYGQPVLNAGADPSLVIAALLDGIRRHCVDSRIRTAGESELPELAVMPAGWTSRPWATFLVDLAHDEDTLWKNLKSSARKAVRKATEAGVTVRRVETLKGLRDYYRFAERCAARTGKHLFGFRDFETMWRHFRGPAVYETFIADWHGKPVAGLSVWGLGPSITELGAFTSEVAAKEHVYGGDLIKWEIIKWASNQGLKTFDLAGFNPAPRDVKETAIRQFKEKWGGLETVFAYVQLDLEATI